ncbi:adenylate kinase [Streptomyces sp. Ru72]|uniref:adenylate kinase n=1 Tax=Streptomyces sp. Ru72 TaxID=2080747 RepID=UPI000D4BF5C5|nr:adenylate kinase [Streptomyces sp. Ru72]POX39193.1 adenylate kinase [Streptomyces sp. Ru72]
MSEDGGSWVMQSVALLWALIRKQAVGTLNQMIKRIVVVGAAGSGKTTLVRALGEALETPVTDLDLLFWGPAWSRVELNVFRERTQKVLANERWIIAGSYFRQVADLVWAQADTVVWLDLPRRVSFSRVLRRTVRQFVRREDVFPGCRQSLRAAWRDRLFHSAWREPEKYRSVIPELLDRPEYGHVSLVHLQSRRAVAAWLANCVGLEGSLQQESDGSS